MKVIDWIKNLIGILKDSAELIKIGLIVALLIFSFVSLRNCKKEKEEKEQTQTILNSEQKKFETELKNKAVEINQWQVSSKELKSINEKLTDKNNVYLNEIDKAKQTIKELDLKLKRAEKYANLSVNSVDTFYTDLIIDGEVLIIEPIKTKNIDISFFKVNDSLRVDYNYRLDVRTMTYIQPKRKQNGKKHFPNWGFIWGWQHNSVAIVDDPKATINNYVEIEFKK